MLKKISGQDSMDSSDPELVALRAELERLDYVVVDHGQHICVRMPLLSSLVITHLNGRFQFVPQFGPFRRTGGLLFTSATSIAAVAASAFTFGVAPLTLLVGFLGVVALAHDACRFVLTEGCLTRLQQLIASQDALAARETPLGLTTPTYQPVLGRAVDLGAIQHPQN
jgi:hypothetical protein